jgi:hypothetical protein
MGSRQKWIGGVGELYATLYLKDISPLTCTIGNKIRHKWFHIFGISTTVNLSVTAVFISH